MLGTIQTAVVLKKIYTNPTEAKPAIEPSTALVEFSDGTKGLLKVDQMPGKTHGHRLKALSRLSNGQTIKVFVTKKHQNFIDGEAYWVSLRRAIRDVRMKLAEELVEGGEAVNGVVSRIVKSNAFVVIPGELEGRLHISRFGGATFQDRQTAFDALKPGDSIEVVAKKAFEDEGKLRIILDQEHLRAPAGETQAA